MLLEIIRPLMILQQHFAKLDPFTEHYIEKKKKKHKYVSQPMQRKDSETRYLLAPIKM